MNFNNYIQNILNERRDPVFDEILYSHEYKSPRWSELTDEDTRVREISYNIKNSGNPDIKVAARDMAELVNADNILVPIPTSKGDTSANLELSNEIAKITGAEVKDILNTASERESNRELGKAMKQRIHPKKMGLSLSDSVDSRKVLFVDNVSTSGASIRAAVNLINGGRGLVFSKVLGNSSERITY
jgi:predicted amidophosphoribosyltransferase